MAAQGYIGRAPGESSVIVARQTFTPTGITTNFTFASGYTVGYVDAYLNGARLIEGSDYTATDGSVVGLTTHAQNGDVLELVVYKAFNVSNVVAAKDDFSVPGDLSVTGTATVTGAITATGGVVGDVTGDATGLSGTPDIAIRNLTGVAATFTGVLSYDDVTNVDSIGFATFRSGINVQGAGSTTTTLNVTGVATVGNNISIGDSIFHTGDGGGTAFGFPAADTFTVYTNDSERIRIDSSGNATLGDSSFGASLGQLRIINDASSSPASLALFGHNNTTTGDPFGQIQFAEQEAGTGGNIKAKIEAQAVSTNERGSDLVLFTAADSASSVATEKLRITSGGDVGIGTDSPTSFGPTLQVAGTDPALLLQDTATAVDYFGMNIASGAVNTWFDDASAFVIHTATGLAGSGLVERLRIFSGGQVAIATATNYANANCDDLIVGNRNSNEQGITIGAKNQGQIAFADLAGDRQGLIHYQHTDDSMRFMTSGAANERVRIRSDGLVGIATAVPEAQLTVKGDGDIAAKDFKYLYSNTHGIQVKGNEPAIDIVGSDSGTHGASLLLRSSTDGFGMYFNPTRDQLVFRYTVPSADDFTIHDGSNTSTNTELLTIGKTGICTATQFDATSDVALKENIEVIDEPIIKLSELKGVTFDWKAGGHSVGVIAQDVEKVLPTAVGGSEDRKTVNYNAIIGLLVESVKDQQKQIEELKSLLDK